MISAMARDFLLVHGMSHGGWAWDALARRLQRGGHRVVAPDLPGHGRRAAERGRASVAADARAAADAAIQAGLSRAIVVGHSMGGVVIPKVAELIPARVAHLVFVAAVVLPERGQPAHHAPVARGRRAAARAGARRRRRRAVSRADRMVALVQRPAARRPARDRHADPAHPQPLRPWRERVDMRRFYAMRLPATCVRCLADTAVPPGRAAEYAARLGVTPIDLACAHSPMLSAPAALTTILTSGAREA
jgi:pimeloyl-ACP methyl ester carboxylesterase